MKKLFLLDMDGTIYLGDQLYEGTAEFLAWVRENGGQYAFLTNNSSRGIEGYLAKMKRMGIPQQPESFLTSADATIDYLKKAYPGCSGSYFRTDYCSGNYVGTDCFSGETIEHTASKSIEQTSFYVCGTENLKGQLRSAGLKVLTYEELDEILAMARRSAAESLCNSKADSPHRSEADDRRISTINISPTQQKTKYSCADNQALPIVLLGYDTELTYKKLEYCVQLLNLGSDYIATHPDLTCPAEYGYVPDIGLVIHSLKVCTDREPKVIGKPQPQMVYTALKKYGASPEETVLIGDRLYTDIACGNNAGIDTILVLSGEGTVEECEKYNVHPTYIYQDIAAVLEALKKGKL